MPFILWVVLAVSASGYIVCAFATAIRVHEAQQGLSTAGEDPIGEWLVTFFAGVLWPVVAIVRYIAWPACKAFWGLVMLVVECSKKIDK